MACNQNDPKWCKTVFQLFECIGASDEIPNAYVRVRCAKYVLQHGYQTKIVGRKLLHFRNRESAEAAILALEYAQQLFQNALRSSVPKERQEAAAALAVLDMPWCHAELHNVLRQSTDQVLTCECRAALAACRDPRAQHLAEKWEEQNPHKPKGGPYITFEEMLLRDRHLWLQGEIERIHDRVLPLRDRLPFFKPMASEWSWLRWFRN